MGFPLSSCLLPEISHSFSTCGSYLNFVFWILQANKTAGFSSGFDCPINWPSLRLEAVKNRKLTQCYFPLLSGCFPVPSVLFIFCPEFIITIFVESVSNRSYSAIIRSRTLHIFFWNHVTNAISISKIKCQSKPQK